MTNVLLVSDCAIQAFTDYIQVLHPDFKVRSIAISKLDDWHETRSQSFVDAVAETDILISLPDVWQRLEGWVPEAHLPSSVDLIKKRELFSTFPDLILNLEGVASEAGMHVIEIPRFRHLGPRVDCFWMPQRTSPLGRGAIHSKIAVSAFALGKTVEDALKLFNGQHYESIGYFEQFEEEREQLFRTYADGGIDITNAYAEWSREGDFQYTPNHPDVRVLTDLIHIATSQSGCFEPVSEETYRSFREHTPNYLENGLVWPVYPELAEYWGLKTWQKDWRTGKRDGLETFGLEEMIARTFDSLNSYPDIMDRIRQYLGAEDVWHWFAEQAD